MTAVWIGVAAAVVALALALALPAISDVLSVLRVAFGRRRALVGGTPSSDSRPPFLLFLVPAHDEELLIGRTAAALGALDYPLDRMRIAVVADNCSDATAEMARDAGLEVFERRDPARPGKPYALEWALEEVGLDGVDAVVIVDADTEIDPDFGRALAIRAPLEGVAFQGFNGVSNPEDNSLTRMSAVFSSARYHFQFPLKERVGLNVPIQGAGSVLGGELLRERGWEAFSICEDWELYAIYTLAGIRIGVEPRARILAQEARSLSQSRSQRERWAAGKITVLLNQFLPILRSGSVGFHQKLDLLGELLAPGPAVHLGVAVVLVAVTVLLPLPIAPWIIALVLLGVSRTALYSGLAILAAPRPVRTAAAFMYLPFYTVWRLGVQVLSFRMVGNKPWVRTERH